MISLDDIYCFIVLLFFIVAMIFTFNKKIKFVDRLEAIFLCIFGIFTYTCLSGGYMLNYTLIDTIWVIIFWTSLIAMIFLLIRKPPYLKRWEVVMFCLSEFAISCVMIEPIVEPVVKNIVK